jgi:hypothetical protein
MSSPFCEEKSCFLLPRCFRWRRGVGVSGLALRGRVGLAVVVFIVLKLMGK